MDSAFRIRRCVEADLERRLKVLPADAAAWKRAALANIAQLGIHASQLLALEDMIEVLIADQTEQWRVLKGAPDAVHFADAYQRLLEKLGGAQDLWRIFRTILGQRQDAKLQLLADTADLIANDCYAACRGEARRWGVIKEDEYREPPLTYLESSLSPSTAGRGESVRMLGFPVREYRNMLLPVPIILLPLDQATSMWMLCSIAHEVGHNLDRDLDSRPGRRLTSEYKKLLIGRVHESREPQWRRWVEEVFADAVAVVLEGAGFAVAMSYLAVPLGPATQLQQPAPTAVHPPFHLRLRLIAGILAETGVPGLRAFGGKLVQLLDGLARPAWEAEYESDVLMIARLLLHEKLESLAGHRLLDLNPDLAMEHAMNVQLAAHWRDPRQPRPHPNIPRTFPFRLVPAAAALATAQLADPDREALDELQGKAVDYFGSINRPDKLAGADDRRRVYLRSLAQRLDFARAPRTPEDEP